ncbi:BolA-like protein [Plasmodiophora brassicae]|uniref:BolA-like protein n=1 Tax=Plasmodiophora brassicae TaxID=37360 RepID=A0A0G4IIJ4_PLABS|nr:hypothetical protein PBRA_003725 [Plasmodiophora brassicae]SPQ94245.1 unnamed protein product [Plasmodiophora brassicae]
MQRHWARLMATVADGPVATAIRDKLSKAFSPVHLLVINESSSHNVPRGSETHFKVFVVTPAFEGISSIDRHRSVQKVLAEELKGGVHALSIIAKTPAQWSSDDNVPASPACMGGDGTFSRKH